MLETLGTTLVEATGISPEELVEKVLSCDIYPDDYEAFSLINELYDGANQAVMQVVEKLAAHPDVALDPNHPLYDAVEKLRAGNRAEALQEVIDFNIRAGLYAPQSPEESAALLKGTMFVLRDSGVFEVSKDGEVLLEVRCDGTVVTHHPIAMFTSKPCIGSDCVPQPAAETAPPQPVEAVIPAKVTGPTVQRVLVDPAPCASGVCDGEPRYTEIMRFDSRADADAFLKTMREDMFAYYQEELPPDEKFVVVDGRCYSIGLDSRGDVGTSPRASDLYISDGVDGGRRIRIPPEQLDEVLEGRRSFDGVADNFTGTERTSIEIEEPVASMQIGVSENGELYLERTEDVATRTVHGTWYEETGLSRQEYARLLSRTLPDAFFNSETSVMERAAILYDVAREQGIPIDPTSAVNLAEIISEEQELGMAVDGSLRDVLERAAVAKVERVKDSIGTPHFYRES